MIRTGYNISTSFIGTLYDWQSPQEKGEEVLATPAIRKMLVCVPKSANQQQILLLKLDLQRLHHYHCQLCLLSLVGCQAHWEQQ